jgi:hypothetical protein
MYWTVLLYQYPKPRGYWVLIKCDPQRKQLYFFDPYGTPPDKQWPYLENPEVLPEPPHVLTSILRRYIIEGYLLSKLYELPPQEFRTQKIHLSVVPLIE